MFNRFNNWYKNLRPFQKITLTFIFNAFYWLIMWLIVEKVFFDENRSWGYHFFHATFMGFFMTVTSNWKELKRMIKGG